MTRLLTCMPSVRTPDCNQATAWLNATNLVRVPSPANGVGREDVVLFVAWRLSCWLEPSLVRAFAERQTVIPHNASNHQQLDLALSRV